MNLKIFNTLSNKEEIFVPTDSKNVRMYVCGPTVYDRPHLGNARSFIIYDVLFRLLQQIYGSDCVTYARNITDVDDKINARAKELSITIQELTTQVSSQFHDDVEYVNCLPPTHEPRATEHIAEMIAIVEKLLARGHAYIVDKHVYFAVRSCDGYAALAGRKLEEMQAGSRVAIADNKRDPEDFVLWKPSDAEDDVSAIFASPWGPGRPGWHIECSAMSWRFLGENFDLHGGGADLIFPHHSNEIAQSCSAFPGSSYAKYWLHNGFLTVGGEKMSKSLGNFKTVYDLVEAGIRGEVVRYMLLNTSYRKPMDFNDKALADAEANLDYLYRTLNLVKAAPIPKVSEDFIQILADDLNTPLYFSKLLELAKQANKATNDLEREQLVGQLKSAGQFIGLLQEEVWFKQSDKDVKRIEQLISERAAAKLARNWDRADEIRQTLTDMGVTLEDHADGTTSWY